ncbi:ATP-binding protein [Desulfobacterales bacterium HSG2]|nr:ATP-binding protein [Desulfobacterales bacterium HSG2]
MNQHEIIEIIRNGESSKVEFRTQDVHPTSLAGEIVAFANFEGGVILLGVDDAGRIIGCTRDDMEEFVINVCRNTVRPSIIPMIEKFVISDKKILAVTIARGDTPHTDSRGMYYIRVGSTKQIPTQQELVRLFQRKNILQFDESPVIRATPGDIDIAKVNRYLAGLDQSPLNEENERALRHDLINLSVLIETEETLHPSFGGLLVFGKNPQRHFPSCNILCGAYSGDDFLSETIREKDLRGAADDLIEDAVAFLKLTMPQKNTLEQDIRRKVSYLYPIEAVREGIVNAVCHRDYTITGSSVRIFLFRDRLEIRSPGGLPNTITLENMLFRQFARNQIIASFLSGYGYMERRGKGILRMIRSCEAEGAECLFSLGADNNEFVVTYRGCQ